MVLTLFIVVFLVWGGISVWFLDRILFAVGFISWMLDGHPGAECGEVCGVHKK